jgi:hypothetical protein
MCHINWPIIVVIPRPETTRSSFLHDIIVDSIQVISLVSRCDWASYQPCGWIENQRRNRIHHSSSSSIGWYHTLCSTNRASEQNENFPLCSPQVAPPPRGGAIGRSSTVATFFIDLIVVDEDPELTKDWTLALQSDYNNYNINIPIRPY